MTADERILREPCQGLTLKFLRCSVVTLLDDGQTAHSAFKLPLDIHKKPDAMCTIEKKRVSYSFAEEISRNHRTLKDLNGHEKISVVPKNILHRLTIS
ncbi:hypothetical protein TNCV_3950761 [Trichonephila clavipes]|nr:hypothetical protein TNCV_3950761 [Trichonephila clavipes]